MVSQHANESTVVRADVDDVVDVQTAEHSAQFGLERVRLGNTCALTRSEVGADRPRLGSVDRCRHRLKLPVEQRLVGEAQESSGGLRAAFCRDA